MKDLPAPLSIDDPRLTAYALGELDATEWPGVHAAVQADPALQAAVAEIRSLSQELSTALAQELDSAPAAAVTPWPAEPLLQVAARPQPRRRWGRVLQFPSLYYVLATGAAAAFGVLLFLRNQENRSLHPGSLGSNHSLVLAGPETGAGDTVAPGEDLSPIPPPVGEGGSRKGRERFVASASLLRSALLGAGGPMPRVPTVIGEIDPARLVADNAFLRARENPLSSFALDVASASYADIQQSLAQHLSPAADLVRIEELVNYFPYAYTPPGGDRPAATPFATHLEVAAAPWAPEHRLVRIGLKARDVSPAERGRANLVFLVDVSGSMSGVTKLPLVKNALRQLIDRLEPDDRMAIVTYAGQSGVLLASTPARDRERILRAIDELDARGSSNGSDALQQAYALARSQTGPGITTRVVLCTDGDFNLGPPTLGELVQFVQDQAKQGVALTTIGFGMGDYHDSALELLALRGKGSAGYVDTRREAERWLVDGIGTTVGPVATDVRLQVEFNPLQVSHYRLIGYENRLSQGSESSRAALDAGELGAGHTVTALYEVILVAPDTSPTGGSDVDLLKYTRTDTQIRALPPETAKEMLTVKIAYRDPTTPSERRVEYPLVDQGATFDAASSDFQFAAAVAGFGMILRDSPHRGTASLAQVGRWAERSASGDPGGYRVEFLALVKQAAALRR